MHIVVGAEALADELPARKVAEILAQPWLESGHTATALSLATGQSDLDAAMLDAGGRPFVCEQDSAQRALAGAVMYDGALYLDGERYLGALSQGRVRGRVEEEGEGPAVNEASVTLGENGLLGTSAPLAEPLLAAASQGVNTLVIGLGDSAVHDGGVGLLRQLAINCGADPEDPAGALATIRGKLGSMRIEVACALDTPLSGLDGAGAQLAHRPGWDANLAQRVDATVGRLLKPWQRASETGLHRNLLATVPQRPLVARYGGSGGGSACALGLLGASLASGIRLVAERVGLSEPLGEADLAIAATKRLDGQSLAEGAPAIVGETAAEEGIAVVAVAWEVDATRHDAARAGIQGMYTIEGQGVETDGGADQSLRQRAERVLATWQG